MPKFLKLSLILPILLTALSAISSFGHTPAKAKPTPSAHAGEEVVSKAKGLPGLGLIRRGVRGAAEVAPKVPKIENGLPGLTRSAGELVEEVTSKADVSISQSSRLAVQKAVQKALLKLNVPQRPQGIVNSDLDAIFDRAFLSDEGCRGVLACVIIAQRALKTSDSYVDEGMQVKDELERLIQGGSLKGADLYYAQRVYDDVGYALNREFK